MLGALASCDTEPLKVAGATEKLIFLFYFILIH